MPFLWPTYFLLLSKDRVTVPAVFEIPVAIMGLKEHALMLLINMATTPFWLGFRVGKKLKKLQIL